MKAGSEHSVGPAIQGASWLSDFAESARWFEGSEIVSPDNMPASCQRLLVHEDHMTLRLRDHYQGPLELTVVEDELTGDAYRRVIVLRLAGANEVVEFGVVRIDLRPLGEEVREAILHRTMPLGDILIKHGVLRRVEPKVFVRFGPPSRILDYFEGRSPDTAFGRLGVIHCNGAAAIELLEVVAE